MSAGKVAVLLIFFFLLPPCAPAPLFILEHVRRNAFFLDVRNISSIPFLCDVSPLNLQSRPLIPLAPQEWDTVSLP